MRMIALLLLVLLPQDTGSRIDDLVERELKKKAIPGVSILVVRNGKTVHARGYGMANFETKTKAAPETVYRIGSITKQFVATGIMILEEEGKLGVDDKLSKFLPDYPRGDDITLHHLLTHTSGIFNMTNAKDWWKSSKEDLSHEQVIALFKDRKLAFEPGEKWAYSNSGYYLLGVVIEKVTGKTWDAFLKERIFDPLGMKDTRLDVPHEIVAGRATGYSKYRRTWRNARYIHMPQAGGAGALISTAVDMAKWDQALYTEKLLKKETLDRMYTPVELNNGRPAGYGYGWGLGQYKKNRLISHSGGINGFTAWIARFPDRKLTIIILINRDFYNIGLIGLRIAGLYLREY